MLHIQNIYWPQLAVLLNATLIPNLPAIMVLVPCICGQIAVTDVVEKYKLITEVLIMFLFLCFLFHKALAVYYFCHR